MPADVVYVTQELTESRLAETLKQHRKTLTIPFSGRYLACDEEVGQRRYCDADCRDTHEATMLRKSRLG